jgi:hypothetical protein
MASFITPSHTTETSEKALFFDAGLFFVGIHNYIAYT